MHMSVESLKIMFRLNGYSKKKISIDIRDIVEMTYTPVRLYL